VAGHAITAEIEILHGAHSRPILRPYQEIVLAVLSLLFCLGCYRPVQRTTVQLVSTSDGVTVTDVRFPSTSIDGLLWYRAVVPPVNAGELLPLLYLLHGANSSPAEIMERSELVNLAIAARLIVVMPEADLSYYSNAKHERHARWEDAIVLELPRDVEAQIPSDEGQRAHGNCGDFDGRVWCGETYIEAPRALWIHGEHERPDGHYTAPGERAGLGADVEDLDHLRCAA
jgi:hypothetical protein